MLAQANNSIPKKNANSVRKAVAPKMSPVIPPK